MKVIILILLLIASVLSNTHDPEFETTFQVKHLRDGDNTNFPKSGDRVIVHYSGTFPDTGKKFDSSLDRREPFNFVLKVGQVIKCWDEVVSRMSKGEKIYVICPSRLAYGERGAGGIIPPNTDIAFEIDLIDFTGKNDL
jgi:FK506-binding protein 1